MHRKIQITEPAKILANPPRPTVPRATLVIARSRARKAVIEPLAPPLAFSQFNKLPPKVRSLIWHAALPGPRLVRLHQHITPTYTFGWGRVRLDR